MLSLGQHACSRRRFPWGVPDRECICLENVLKPSTSPKILGPIVAAAVFAQFAAPTLAADYQWDADGNAANGANGANGLMGT